MHNVIKQMSKSAFNLAQQILKHQDDAADVLQDAVHVALSHDSVPDHQGSDFKPWFFRVVRNKAIDKFRQRKVHAVDEVDTDELETTTDEPSKQLEQVQQAAALRAAIETLSFEHREIILLRDFHGMSYDDIAKVIGVAKGSVMSRLHRARLALKKAFELLY
ncbi:MAG: sigma-70 family RNA polymerase sigma factor [Algicola sp.]|nr:sigma-70 family RNA polymerase sigma factor [Algicola sp.]